MNNLQILPLIAISFAENLVKQPNFAEIELFYQTENLEKLLNYVLEFLYNRPAVILPAIARKYLFVKPVELDVYVVDLIEGQSINFEARGKDYPTNILSYPSDLPSNILDIMPSVPLGELIICHDVVVQQAKEQNKSIVHHLTHLWIHGILHLLGFDHELGQKEQAEMEGLEIAILAGLGIANPYE